MSWTVPWIPGLKLCQSSRSLLQVHDLKQGKYLRGI
jgi:hypothetical protein